MRSRCWGQDLALLPDPRSVPGESVLRSVLPFDMIQIGIDPLGLQQHSLG